MPTSRVRVLVVEDSLTVRRRLCEVLAADPLIEVVGEAENGKQAIALCLSLRPDILTMDMMLPVMSGLGATEYIMAHCPTPILIVSSSTNRGELFKTYEALAAGAVEVMEKPRGDDTDAAWEREFLATVKLVSRIRVMTHIRARLGTLGQPRTDGRGGPGAGGVVVPVPSVLPQATPAGATAVTRPPAPTARTGARFEVVLIGASTGGPGAILEILRALPQPFPLPILFVLHIGDPFASSFAEWLDGQTGMRIAFARHGELIAARAGQVIMAPADAHLAVRNGRCHLTKDPPRHSCRPAVDVLFESAAREYGARALACLLTGMGRDGAAGLLELRAAGAFTIAQDESTSVVYGMPREAVLLGAVDRELPLGQIGATLAAMAARREDGQAP